MYSKKIVDGNLLVLVALGSLLSDDHTETSSQGVVQAKLKNPRGAGLLFLAFDSPVLRLVDPVEDLLEVSCEVGGQVRQAVGQEHLPDVAQTPRDFQCVGSVADVEVYTVLGDNKGLFQALQQVVLQVEVWCRPVMAHPQLAALQCCDDSSERTLQITNLGS